MDTRPPYTPSYPANQYLGDDIQPRYSSRTKGGGGGRRREELFHEQERILSTFQDEAAIAEFKEELAEAQAKQVREEEDKSRKKRKVAAGFWLFGHAKKHVMAPGFRNPDMCSVFTLKILAIMITRQLIRQPCLLLLLLYQPWHDRVYESITNRQPIIAASVIYALFLLISRSKRMTILIRKYQLHAVMFVLSEITLAVVLCFAAFVLEYGAIQWYGTLDTFNDYDENNHHDRHNWRQLKVTPAVGIIIYDLQITVNMSATLLLQAFTPIHVGAHELYRIMIWLAFLTFILSFLVVITSSYGLLPIWDGMQSVFGTLGGLGKSWLFVYKISRLVSGQMVPVDSMDWNDVFYAAYVVF